MDETILPHIDSIKVETIPDINPWMVDNVSVFLNYCCPECDFKEKNLQFFSDHALENHEKAYALFDKVSIDIKENENLDYKSDFKNIFKGDQLDISGDISETINQDAFELHESYLKSEPCDFIEANSVSHDSEKYLDKDMPIFSKCSLCDFQVEYSFRNKKILTHILNEHGDDSNGHSTYKCQKCGKELAKLRAMKEHMKANCLKKRKKYTKQKQTKQKTVDGIPSCEVCLIDFPSSEAHNAHNQEKHICKINPKMKCCIHCDYQNSNWNNLRSHIHYKHSEHYEKKNICEECGEAYIYKDQLGIHKTRKHMNIVCEICAASYTNRESYNAHMTNKHSNLSNDFVCEECGFSTVSKMNLRKHIRNIHKTEKHSKCPLCPFRSPYKVRVKAHIDAVHPEHGEKKFFCHHCSNGYIYEESLKIHTDNLKVKDRYKGKSLNINCDYCEEILDSPSVVRNHYKTEHPNKPIVLSNYPRFNCDQCSTFFFSEVPLKVHHKRAHENYKRKLSIPCDYCDEILDTTYRTKAHYKNLHPNQPIITKGFKKHNCTHCRDFFYFEQELDRHCYLEHDVKTLLHYCKTCKIPYREKHDCGWKKVVEKMKLKRYYCNQCPKDFSLQSGLDDHIKVVHESRLDFGCDQCGKKLVSKIRLLAHVRQAHSSHIICDICNKKIANPDQLKRHKVFTHKETKGAFFCEKCPKSVFFLKKTYEHHLKDKHGIIKVDTS